MKALIGILLLLCSCNFTDTDHWSICDEVKIHVDAFYREAAKRGIHIQHDNMQISLKKSMNEYGYGARGYTYSSNPPIITLDTDYVLDLVNRSKTSRRPHAKEDSLQLQYLVFHELGHAVLFRDHNQGFSIMGIPRGYEMEYANDADQRVLLIDELFHKSINNNSPNKNQQ